MDDRMLSREWLTDGYSPGKRSDSEISPEMRTEAEQELERLVRRRAAIATLKRLLLKMKTRESLPLPRQVKRSCAVRLGGLCMTETLDRAVDQYYYLKSKHSPGKRRRRDISAKHVQP